MLKVAIIGVDLAKDVFQLHCATEDGTVVLRKKLTRPLFERFMAGHHPCTVAMKASARAHHWARVQEPPNSDGGHASVHAPPRALDSTAARMAAIDRRPSAAVGKWQAIGLGGRPSRLARITSARSA